MATWLIPALKAVLPYVTPIVTSAMPVFTKRQTEEAAAQASVLQQQIDELQRAASQNAQNVKALAAQLEKTVTALEADALIAERRLRQALVVAGAALVVSLVAVALAVWALFLR